MRKINGAATNCRKKWIEAAASNHKDGNFGVAEENLLNLSEKTLRYY
jgi:hypothetical protein